VGDVQAANVFWTDAGPDSLWSTPENWDTGTLPTSADLVRINSLPGPTVANEGAVANAILVGPEGNTGALTIDGGTLTTELWAPFGHGGGDGTLNMISGNNFWPGSNGGTGTVNMTGGTITCTNFQIPDAGTGHVDLHGGTISTGNFGMKASGKMDVTTGTLIISGDRLSLVQGYIDSGLITAYEGSGTLNLDYNVTNEGRTTLTAIHNLRPNPADGGIAVAGEVELSWTLPDPCVPGQPVFISLLRPLVNGAFSQNLPLPGRFAVGLASGFAGNSQERTEQGSSLWVAPDPAIYRRMADGQTLKRRRRTMGQPSGNLLGRPAGLQTLGDIAH